MRGEENEEVLEEGEEEMKEICHVHTQSISEIVTYESVLLIPMIFL